jgi:hypothetical protein
VNSLHERLLTVEKKLVVSKRRQSFLEVETAEKVVSRVKKWAGLFLYWTFIPLVIIVIGLSVFAGKDLWSLRKAASNAKPTIDAVLEQARGIANDAKKTADTALHTARQADSDIRQTQSLNSKLREEVSSREADVEHLSKSIQTSESQVQALNQSLQTNEQHIQQLTREVATANNAQNANEVLNMYPWLGTHFVSSPSGAIDPKQKEAGLTYLTFSIFKAYFASPPIFKLNDIAELKTTLENHKYRVFLGFVQLYSGNPGRAIQAVSGGLGQNTCNDWANPPTDPPCILYFRPDLKDSAIFVRNSARALQQIPDNQIVLVNPKNLRPEQQELLTLSHMDISLVLLDKP